MTGVLIRRGERNTQREQHHVTIEAEIGVDAAASPGMSRIDSHHEKQGRGKERFSTPDFRGDMALLTP